MQKTITTRCCIVGGGPAGVMTGLLLARSGAEVLVLEKHADFFRDFRGDYYQCALIVGLRRMLTISASLTLFITR
ncbi:MAG: FAD-dependent monooxygenase [Salinisphaera sp.]|nr:FAD-dependent monooxygenase [Salinisphaera sp.]